MKQGYILYQPLVVVAVFPTPKPKLGVADDVADGKPVVGPKLKAIFYVCLAQTEYSVLKSLEFNLCHLNIQHIFALENSVTTVDIVVSLTLLKFLVSVTERSKSLKAV